MSENDNKTNIISTENVYRYDKKHFFTSHRWKQILRYGFNQANINRVYKLPFQIKNDIRISMFQYKIIHNILPTKFRLFKAKISDNDICPQCLTDRHSLDLMFLHCSLTLSFWNLFQNWWSSKTKENITLSNSMILYGIFDNKMHMYTLNYTLLTAKFSIYCKCLHDEKLCFDSLMSLLKEKVNIQREIAIQNDKLTKFTEIYGIFL